MRCLAPIHVKNNHVGLRSPYQYYTVPCGKCEACVKNKSSQWFVRLKMQQKYSRYCWFVTLTYNDENLPVRIDNGKLYNDVCKEDVILYHKRLRKELGKRSQQFKYFLVAEYGSNFSRPHYHAIYFDLMPEDLPKIESCWDKGFVQIDSVGDGAIKYVCGYVIEKLFVPDGCLPVFNLISKGLGKKYIEDNKEFHLDIDRSYVPMYGKKFPMPRYYKDRFFNDGQRALLANRYSEEAEKQLQAKIDKFGLHEVEKVAYEVRSNYIRKVRADRKKSKRKI